MWGGAGTTGKESNPSVPNISTTPHQETTHVDEAGWALWTGDLPAKHYSKHHVEKNHSIKLY